MEALWDKSTGFCRTEKEALITIRNRGAFEVPIASTF